MERQHSCTNGAWLKFGAFVAQVLGQFWSNVCDLCVLEKIDKSVICTISRLITSISIDFDDSVFTEKPVPGEADLCMGAIEVASLLRSLSQKRNICVWKGIGSSEPAEKPVLGEEDLCMGGHRSSEPAEKPVPERKICVWGP